MPFTDLSALALKGDMRYPLRREGNILLKKYF